MSTLPAPLTSRQGQASHGAGPFPWFPAEIAIGEVGWEDAREPGGWGHLLAIGVVDVPDGTAVTLYVNDAGEVTVATHEPNGR